MFSSSGCQIKTTTSWDGGLKLYHADHDFTKGVRCFGISSENVFVFSFFFCLCVVVLLRKTFRSANVQYELENKRRWREIVVVVWRRVQVGGHLSSTFFSPGWFGLTAAGGVGDRQQLLPHRQLPIPHILTVTLASVLLPSHWLYTASFIHVPLHTSRFR